MKKYILGLSLCLALVLGVGIVGISSVHAQTTGFPAGCSSTFGYSATTDEPCSGTSVATPNPNSNSIFPNGCASNLGYSATTASPCNGTAGATVGPMPGCTTPLGYSDTNGEACSGGPVAINFLGGCTSIYGYSSVTGEPCNGTQTAALFTGVTTPATTPGLPTTGAGGDAPTNILLILVSSLVVLLGASYIIRQFKLRGSHVA